jgi:eukaryotic-like serine/threonine-protein kinase
MRECPNCHNCFPDSITTCPTDGSLTVTTISGESILDGRYSLERRLGQGGMGVVFKARHIFLKTQHAIKVILPDLVGNDPQLVTRFRQEALASAAIRQQNIVAVTDYGVANGTMPFLVMEFVQGKSLHDILLADSPMPLARALEIIQAACAGVSAAHRQGIIHRDLKPLNIMIQYDLPISEALKILDFGLAKIKSGELLGSFIQAKTSGLMGSPLYMAPEQWSDEEPDARSDIYSLGVILFQMLAGDVPFSGSSIPSVMKKHLTGEVPRFASFGVDIPLPIEEAVLIALKKDPAERPVSVDAFIAGLREAVQLALPSLSPQANPFILESTVSPSDSLPHNELRIESTIAPPGVQRSVAGTTSSPNTPQAFVFTMHGTTLAPAVKAPDVFICYASEDKDIGKAICEALEAQGIDCWIAPRNVLPGMTYAKAIINALKTSRVMILLFSAESNSSPQVMREVERAASIGIPIIPVLIENVPLSDDMQFYVSSPQWLDATTPPLDKHLGQLITTVRWHLRMPS